MEQPSAGAGTTSVSHHRRLVRPYSAITSGRAHTCALRQRRRNGCLLGVRPGPHQRLQGPGDAALWRSFRGHQRGRGLYMCAVRLEDFSPVCWGEGFHLDLPEEIPFSSVSGESFTSVSSGGAHACALREDQTAACWGDNSAGVASPPPERFSAISSGSNSHMRPSRGRWTASPYAGGATGTRLRQISGRTRARPLRHTTNGSLPSAAETHTPVP